MATTDPLRVPEAVREAFYDWLECLGQHTQPDFLDEGVRAVLTAALKAEWEGLYAVQPGDVRDPGTGVQPYATAAYILTKSGGLVLWRGWTDVRDGTPRQQADASTARARAVCAALNITQGGERE